MFNNFILNSKIFKIYFFVIGLILINFNGNSFTGNFFIDLGVFLLIYTLFIVFLNKVDINKNKISKAELYYLFFIQLISIVLHIMEPFRYTYSDFIFNSIVFFLLGVLQFASFSQKIERKLSEKLQKFIFVLLNSTFIFYTIFSRIYYIRFIVYIDILIVFTMMNYYILYKSKLLELSESSKALKFDENNYLICNYLINITNQKDISYILKILKLSIKNNENQNEIEIIKSSHNNIINTYHTNNNLKLFFGIIFCIFLPTIILGIPLIISYNNDKKMIKILIQNYEKMIIGTTIKDHNVNNSNDIVSVELRLKELKKIYDSQLISEEEYNKRKEEILKEL